MTIGTTMKNLNTIDFLFIKFGGCHIKLNEICDEYYPHLSKEKMLEKARLKQFPFTCFRIDNSQKGPLFVDIKELASVFDDLYKKSYIAFRSSVEKELSNYSK